MQHINEIIILFQLGSGRHLLRQKELSLAQIGYHADSMIQSRILWASIVRYGDIL